MTMIMVSARHDAHGSSQILAKDKVDMLRMISRPAAVGAPPNKRRDLSVSDLQLSMRSWTRGLKVEVRMTCPCVPPRRTHAPRKIAPLASFGGPPQCH